jgi:uncharacterized protein
MARRARFRELNRRECEELLRRNEIGRIAYTFRDRPGIEPLHYVYHEGWLYGRTSEGEKLATIERNWWVAFGVEEIQGPHEWRSVMVRGGLYRLDPGGPPEDVAAREQAIELIRQASPEAFTEDDPTPQRDVLFRIAAQELSGRESRLA